MFEISHFNFSSGGATTLTSCSLEHLRCRKIVPFTNMVQGPFKLLRYPMATSKAKTAILASERKETKQANRLKQSLRTSLQFNRVSEYLEGHTKSVLLTRGTCYQYWLTYVVYMSKGMGEVYGMYSKYVYLCINNRLVLTGVFAKN